jgi:TolA-binding protein
MSHRRHRALLLACGLLPVLFVAPSIAAESPGEQFRFAKRMLLERQDYGEAAKAFDHFLAAHPKDQRAAEALGYLALCQTHMDNHRGALKSYRRLLKEFPDADETLRLEATAYGADAAFRAGDYAGAIDLYTRLLEDFPESKLAEGALFWRGEAHYRSANGDPGALRAAAADFLSYRETRPEGDLRADALYNAAFATYESGQYDPAAERFGLFVEAYPGDGRAAECSHLRAESLFALENYEEALASYAQVWTEAPQSDLVPEARAGAGWCHRKLDRFAKAAAAFEVAAGMDRAAPERRAAWRYQAALAHMEADAPDRAAPLFRSVARDDAAPDRGPAALRLGAMRVREAEALSADSPDRPATLRDAKELLEIATAACEGQQRAEAWSWRGEAALLSGEYAAAGEAFEHAQGAFGRAPGAAAARYNRAYALGQLGRDAQAANVLGGFAEDHPDHPLRPDAALALAQFTDDATVARESWQWLAGQMTGWAQEAGIPAKRRDAYADLRAEALFQLGELDRKRDPASAKSAYQRYVKEYPAHEHTALARLRLGDLAEAAGSTDAARAAYEAAFETSETSQETAQHALLRLGILDVETAQKTEDSARRRELADQGAKRLMRLLGTDPDASLRAQAHYYRGEAHALLLRHDEALGDYRAALKSGATGPTEAAALMGLGWSHRQRGEHEAAVMAFDRIARKFPESPNRVEAAYLRCLSLADGGATNKALGALASFVEEHPDLDLAVDALLKQSAIRRGIGEADALEAADDLLSAFAEDHPQHPRLKDVHLERSNLLATRAEPAVQAASRAREDLMAATGGVAWEDLSDALKTRHAGLHAAWKKARDEARDAEADVAAVLETLIHRWPQASFAASVRLRRAEIAYAYGEYATAAEHYRAALEAPGRKAIADKALYRLGWCALHRAGDANDPPVHRQTALERFRQLAGAHGDSPLAPEAHFRIAEILRDRGEEKAALTHYRQAAAGAEEDDPFAAAARYGEGVCLLRLDQPGEAFEVFTALIERSPRGEFFHEAHWGAGQAALETGAVKDARRHFDAARAGDYAGEAAAKAQYGLGLLAAGQNEWQEAREAFLKVDLFYPQWPRWAARGLWKAADAAEELGRTEKAREDRERILEVYPETGAAAMLRETDNDAHAEGVAP